jgi:hypothetical protein
MSRRGLYVPRLHDKNVRRLYHNARRFTMPVSRLLNLIVAVGLEQLEAVNDPAEWEDYTLVPPQEEEDNHSVCRDFAENTPTPVVAQSQSCRIHERGYLAHAPVRSYEPLHHEHG